MSDIYDRARAAPTADDAFPDQLIRDQLGLPVLDLPNYGNADAPTRPLKRDGRPRITVAGSPCLIAEVEHAAARNGVSTMEWCRQAWQAALDGYPTALPEYTHAWVERQARTMGVSWSEAHAAVMGEVARRYPRGVRL